MKTFKRVSAIVSFGLVLAMPIAALAAGPAAINLGSSGNFTILSKTGISTTGSTAVVGDIGVSPAPASYITGFALILPAASASSTSTLVTGKVYASDYPTPTPANLTTAVLDMQNAYTDGMGRAADTTELGAGNIGGLTLAPGVYKWGTGVSIPADVTLSGAAGDVWIFQIAQNLVVSSAAKIILSGGAQASNIFWVVAGQTTIGTGAVFNGTILDQTAVVLNTNAQLNGRALAQTAVTLDSNAVTKPASAASTPAPAPTPAPTYTPAPATTPTYTPTPTSNSTPVPTQTQTSSLGQAIVLGNGQTVYVNSGGSFTDAQGRPVSGGTVFSSTAGVTAPASNNGEWVFNKDLWMDTSGSEVQMLQRYLNAHGYMVAASGHGSAGNETLFFGELTNAALAKFQAAVGISPALGYFGPITRAYISAH